MLYRTRPSLAVLSGEDADDAVGLTELVGPQHDPLSAVQAHARTLLVHPSESAVSALVLADRLEEVLTAEDGPEGLGEDELAVEIGSASCRARVCQYV